MRRCYREDMSHLAAAPTCLFNARCPAI